MPILPLTKLALVHPARFGVGAALITAAVSLSGCRERGGAAAAAPPIEPRSVSLVPVQVRPAERFVQVTGTLYGEEEVTIAAEVPGRVVAISADLGDEVAQGELLLRIEPTDYELAVEEAQAEVLSILAKLGLTALPQGDVDLSLLPVVQRADAEEANANARLQRARKLFERDPPLLSEQDFADIKTQHEVASTSAAVERLSASALVADARVRASALRQAQQRLADTRVYTPAEQPMNYRVAARRVSVGEVVSQNQALFRLVASDKVKFRGLVPERFARDVAVGATAHLQLDAFPAPFEAVVSRIAPAVDIATRSFEVEIQAENPDGRLKPGSFVRARIVTSTQTDARYVPESAVAQFAGVQRLFSVRNGKVVEHRVRLGKVVDGQREVLDELAGVDRVIDRPGAIGAGMPVSIQN